MNKVPDFDIDYENKVIRVLGKAFKKPEFHGAGVRFTLMHDNDVVPEPEPRITYPKRYNKAASDLLGPKFAQRFEKCMWRVWIAPLPEAARRCVYSFNHMGGRPVPVWVRRAHKNLKQIMQCIETGQENLIPFYTASEHEPPREPDAYRALRGNSTRRNMEIAKYCGFRGYPWIYPYVSAVRYRDIPAISSFPAQRAKAYSRVVRRGDIPASLYTEIASMPLDDAIRIGNSERPREDYILWLATKKIR